PHDVPLNTWRDYLDVMKKFDQASLGSAESVAKLEDALRKMDFSSLESAGTKFKSQFDNLSIKPDGDHQFLSWTNDLKELNAKIDEYNSKVKYLKENNIVDGKQVDEVKKLRDEIEEIINVMTKTPQTKRGWTDIGASKAAEKVANVLKQNTKMSKEAKDAIRAYYNELRSGNPSQPIDEILVKVNQLVQKERELGRVGKSFGEIFKEKVIYGGAAQLAGMVGFYDVINVGREAFNVIKDLDSAYTEMRKVSDETAQSLKNFQSASFDVAKQVGVTALEIQNSAADFMRLGYSLKEASKLSEDANIYANVGDMDISEATEHMISSIQAWQSEFSSVTEASTNIIDRYNEVNFLPLCA
ncbi:MAG: phage tail tape measure protein, partial [Erysipelotrichaceae bacterium]|nr:phage tail tape measure protein [Erysipelotrichaceae bacterium]